MRIINLPCKDSDITDLKTGDIIYISGLLITGRDKVYQKVTLEGVLPPIDLNGLAVYHAGPIVREDNSIINESDPSLKQKWNLISIGPTTSARMETQAAEFLKKTGVKIMIGKGGMGEKTALACAEYKAIYCAYPGGCAVLGASQIEKIEDCHWPEFTMAERAWVMRTLKMGPLIVSIDTYANNLYAENYSYYNERKITAQKKIFT